MHIKYGYKAVLTAAALALTGAAILLLADSHSTQAGEKQTNTESLPVVKVERGAILQQIELSGEFRPYQEVDVDAKVKGYVKTLKVDIGDRVKQGQILAVLEIPEAKDDLAKAVAAVERARQHAVQSQALAGDAQAMYERLAAVMKERPDLIAQQDIDQAKARTEAATAAAIADRSAVVEAEAHKNELRDMMSYTEVAAPFDGVVTQLYTDVGALIGDSAGHGGVSGHSIVHLAQLDHLRLIVKIPESLVPKVHGNDSVSISIPALSVTKQAQITRVSHQIDLQTRTMHVEVDYPNADTAITPGLYADVKFPVDSHADVLVVPLQAISARRDQSGKVLVLRPDGAVESRTVALGLINATLAEVRSGLDAGDLVVVGTSAKNEKGITYVPKMMAQN